MVKDLKLVADLRSDIWYLMSGESRVLFEHTKPNQDPFFRLMKPWLISSLRGDIEGNWVVEYFINEVVTLSADTEAGLQSMTVAVTLTLNYANELESGIYQVEETSAGMRILFSSPIKHELLFRVQDAMLSKDDLFSKLFG